MADTRFTGPIITFLKDAPVGEVKEGLIQPSWAKCEFLFLLSGSLMYPSPHVGVAGEHWHGS